MRSSRSGPSWASCGSGGGGSGFLLQVCATAWVVYGVISMVARAQLYLPEAAARFLMNVGLAPAAKGFSAIEAMVARGAYAAAAEAYRDRSRDPWVRTEACLRRAALLAGPLGRPAAAITELETLRREHPPDPADDIWIGRTLADLHERRAGDPGRAMAELRRLLDRHPESPQSPLLRRTLEALRAEHFGDPTPDGRGTRPEDLT